MNRHAREFRRIAAKVCGLRGFSLKQFLEDWGLEETLVAAETNQFSPSEIAALVLSRCCVADGKFNHFQIGLLAVITYLNEVYRHERRDRSQDVRDLVSVLNSGGSYEALLQWARSHYP